MQHEFNLIKIRHPAINWGGFRQFKGFHVRQYLCWNKTSGAYYIALSMFDDVLDERYSKPIYIEKTPTTAMLQGKCEERIFLGREFYSLIKTPESIYRFNADIYSEAHSVLGLTIIDKPDLGFKLMQIPRSEIRSIFYPKPAYVAARDNNSTVRSAASAFLSDATVSEFDLGLIGSLGIDPHAATHMLRDLDLVFCGPLNAITRAYNWVRSEHLPMQPLRRALPSGLPTICSFYQAEPSVYPDLTLLRVLKGELGDFTVLILEPLVPAFLNIQIYSARDLISGGLVTLVIRDTLSRDMLPIEAQLNVRAYLCNYNGARALLITDVEQQILGIPFHGGGLSAHK